MRLYLDVDGTLLRRSGHARLRGELAPATNLLRFFEWAAAGFECRWVTSRTRHGDVDRLLPVLRQAIGPGDEWDRIQAIAASFATPVWRAFKAEAMDLGENFIWLDDAPEDESIAALHRAGRHACWVKVDIDRCPDDLRRVMTLVDGLNFRAVAE
jgi:hypothetical protein